MGLRRRHSLLSQTLIITRMEGRSGVPQKESIESLAAHQASMAIYLSTGMLRELSRRLIVGGYAPDTPAALVYKATWPEEEAYICTVETLAQVAEEHGITKTALVLVGDVITHGNYQKSRLYAADFSTEFRQAKSSVRQDKQPDHRPWFLLCSCGLRTLFHREVHCKRRIHRHCQPEYKGH